MLPGINSMFLLEVTQGIEPSESKLNLMTQNIRVPKQYPKQDYGNNTVLLISVKPEEGGGWGKERDPNPSHIRCFLSTPPALWKSQFSSILSFKHFGF